MGSRTLELVREELPRLPGALQAERGRASMSPGG
jgi:hypothetical protein